MRKVLLMSALSVALLTSGIATPFSKQTAIQVRQSQNTSTRIHSRKNKCGVKQGQRRARKARNVQRNKAHH